MRRSCAARVIPHTFLYSFYVLLAYNLSVYYMRGSQENGRHRHAKKKNWNEKMWALCLSAVLGHFCYEIVCEFFFIFKKKMKMNLVNSYLIWVCLNQKCVFLLLGDVTSKSKNPYHIEMKTKKKTLTKLCNIFVISEAAPHAYNRLLFLFFCSIL